MINYQLLGFRCLKSILKRLKTFFKALPHRKILTFLTHGGETSTPPIPSTFLTTQVVKVIKNNAKINVQVGEEYQNSNKFSVQVGRSW